MENIDKENQINVLDNNTGLGQDSIELLKLIHFTPEKLFFTVSDNSNKYNITATTSEALLIYKKLGYKSKIETLDELKRIISESIDKLLDLKLIRIDDDFFVKHLNIVKRKFIITFEARNLMRKLKML